MRKEYAGVAINKIHNYYKYLTHKGFIDKNRESLRAAYWVISCSYNIDVGMGNKTKATWDDFKRAGYENEEAFHNFMECVFQLEGDLDNYFKPDWINFDDEESYINDNILQGFQSKTGYFNYQKLITLIEELNFNYSNKKTYSACMVLRAILDHVPPLLDKDDFSSMVNNHIWGNEKSSRRKAVKELLTFRNIPDDVLHNQITDKSDVIDFTYLPSKFSVNVLLKECLESKIELKTERKFVKQKNRKDDNISLDLRIDFDELKISWANYAVRSWVWPSFRMVLSINNFRNKSPEYIKAYLVGNSNDGRWEARNFIFLNREDESKTRSNEDFRVEAGYKEKVSLFVSNYDIGFTGQKPMPDIDKDSLELIIETESEKKITLPIKAGWIYKG
ncbi:hypothetical protein A3A93_01470 [Candidatus Roizmanbacteria bacterium RIFCSPLOWO2_01_FULL_38_12]|uniref:Uncharacterized protein n=1 Tax=Candidatus Roizmanbacteria bacterium RIFCSPLOWO2_01_FULL_38_12 TaxID=1802061 RepID=A0A1F7IY67_9BACT|nr:MAG: hypothetical protein A2861_00620 [Candidatus Roizmanbacteria bacterium RIFCSPHIGHO2_01_FULL_38_15]OGK34461.1 MAG: hypothetical protein A3F59_03995 [Candidatus Roizmanbacteria bacterium RIFCSPHIGHO2_12_FULL_38_13]OGK48291.1 MAG: hypothetical protein A3A93_01470 [Candidatus Roizmanbacteria bacterium RIFCSPLOWO2_01_FULL_38_12]